MFGTMPAITLVEMIDHWPRWRVPPSTAIGNAVALRVFHHVGVGAGDSSPRTPSGSLNPRRRWLKVGTRMRFQAAT